MLLFLKATLWETTGIPCLFTPIFHLMSFSLFFFFLSVYLHYFAVYTFSMLDFYEVTAVMWFYAMLCMWRNIRRVTISRHCLAFSEGDVHQGVSQSEPSEESLLSPRRIFDSNCLFVSEFGIELKASCIPSKQALFHWAKFSALLLLLVPIHTVCPAPKVWTCLLQAAEQFWYVTLTGPQSPDFKVPTWGQFGINLVWY